jgi:hypothetical protein
MRAMSTAEEAAQQRDWQVLHDAITATLDRFGRKDAFGEGDYWLLDDNWGRLSQQLEFQNLKLFKPQIVRALQDLLAGYPDWVITVRVAVPGKEKIWPGMGLIIYSDEVIDELRRDFLPAEFRDVFFGAVSKETAAALAERVRKLMKK